MTTHFTTREFTTKYAGSSIDGTKIKANAAWGSLEPIEPATSLNEYLENRYGWDEGATRQEEEKPEDPHDDVDPTPRGGVNFRSKSLKNDDYRSSTDPDALIHRKNDGEGASLADIGNICLDTKHRVVLGAEASQGRTSGEWTAGANMLDFVRNVLGFMPGIVTADKGYGVCRFYSEFEKRGITPHVPPLNSHSETDIPRSRLLRMQTVPFDRGKKMIERRRGLAGRNKAHRLKRTTGFRVSRLLRLRVEHKIGEAKVDNQVKITAAVMNLKQLAKHHRRSLRARSARAAASLVWTRDLLKRLLRVSTETLARAIELSLEHLSQTSILHRALRLSQHLQDGQEKPLPRGKTSESPCPR